MQRHHRNKIFQSPPSVAMGSLSKRLPARGSVRRCESDVSDALLRRIRSSSDPAAPSAFRLSKRPSFRLSKRPSFRSSTQSLSSLGLADDAASVAGTEVDPEVRACAVREVEGKKASFHAALPASLMKAREARDVVAPFHRREVLLGPRLGSGEFSHVFEAIAFELQDAQFGESTVSDQQEKRRRHMKKYERYRETRKTRYAVKHIKEDYHRKNSADAYVQATSDLALEAEFLTALQHPNIIKLRGISSDGAAGLREGPRGFFLVLDRLTETLDQRLRTWREARNGRQKPSLTRSLSLSLTPSFAKRPSLKPEEQRVKDMDERCNIALQISAALAYLHSHSIIFRDLKPDNIGFDVRGDVKIFDFGLARVLPAGGNPETDAFMMSGAGSPRYMAPECLARSPYNLKSDVYSFAIVLHEMLSGHQPYGFIRRKHQLVDYVVRQHGRPEIDGGWPAPVQGMIASSFDADMGKRPKMQSWYTVLRETLVSLRDGDRRGLGDSYINRRRSNDSMRDLSKDLESLSSSDAD